MNNRISFGSDPEFQVISRDGELISAISVLPKANKDNKIDLGAGNQLFYDNVLLELNIKPGYSEDEVVSNIRTALTYAARQIQPATLSPRASATYPKSQCQHPDASVFGCEAEYCAYTLTQVKAPICEDTFRSAGGHIHLGCSEKRYPLNAPFAEKCPEGEERKDRDWGRVWVIRMMDLFVGVPSVMLDHDRSSAARRKLYGLAGTHRPQEKYGVEYRSMGNFWLNSIRMTRLVYKLSMFVVDFVTARGHLKLWKDEQTCVGYDKEMVIKAINNTDKKLAGNMMEVVKKYLPNDLYMQIFQMSDSEPPTRNFYQEWNIG